MEICEKDLYKATWEYSSAKDGEHFRFAEVKGTLVTQKRVTFPENSKRRLSLKALQGQYTLMDMKIRGTGNSYLITGWETIPSLVHEVENAIS
jgi:hypothetical protein